MRRRGEQGAEPAGVSLDDGATYLEECNLLWQSHLASHRGRGWRNLGAARSCLTREAVHGEVGDRCPRTLDRSQRYHRILTAGIK